MDKGTIYEEYKGFYILRNNLSLKLLQTILSALRRGICKKENGQPWGEKSYLRSDETLGLRICSIQTEASASI